MEHFGDTTLTLSYHGDKFYISTILGSEVSLYFIYKLYCKIYYGKSCDIEGYVVTHEKDKSGLLCYSINKDTILNDYYELKGKLDVKDFEFIVKEDNEDIGLGIYGNVMYELHLNLPIYLLILMDEMINYRNNKQYEISDGIRSYLLHRGYTLEKSDCLYIVKRSFNNKKK